MQIGILGPGAIGGLLGALLWRARQDVLCIGREDRVAQIQREGIAVDSPTFGNFIARPDAVSAATRALDLLLVAVKGPQLRSSLQRIPRQTVASAIVVPLLNGIGHREVIQEVLGAPVAAGTIGFVEVALSAGTIRQLSAQQPHIDLGSESIPAAALERVAEVLRLTGITVSVLDSEPAVIWKKLVRLNAIATTTAAAQQPVGWVRTDPTWRQQLEGVVREGTAVARREGVEMEAQAVLAAIDKLPEGLTTSLQRDIAAGLPSEVDCIPGGVLRRAQQYGLPHVHLSALYQTLKSMNGVDR